MGVYTNSIEIYLQLICTFSSANWEKQNLKMEKKKKKRLSGPHGKRLTQVLRAQTSCLAISGLIQAS